MDNRSICKPSATLMPFNKTPSEDSVIELIVRDEVPSAEQEDFYTCESDFPPRVNTYTQDSASLGNSSSSQNATEMPEVTKLKEINLQLYQHALKSILSEK